MPELTMPPEDRGELYSKTYMRANDARAAAVRAFAPHGTPDAFDIVRLCDGDIALYLPGDMIGW